MNKENILGLVATVIGVYFGYQAFTSTGDVTPMMWGRALLPLVAGLGFLGYNSFTYLKGAVLNFGTKKTNSLKTNSGDEPIGGIAILTEEEKDMESIYYLTERCKTEGTGLDICRQLNDLFFSIHHSKGEKK